MDLRKHARDQLLAEIPLFLRIQPLARPRVMGTGRFGKIWQPLDNQKELRLILKQLPKLRLDQPVMVDIYINLKQAMSNKTKAPIGKNHGDEDNLRKAVNDALVSAKHLVDDSLVVGGETCKAWGEDQAVIQIWSLGIGDVPVKLNANYFP